LLLGWWTSLIYNLSNCKNVSAAPLGFRARTILNPPYLQAASKQIVLVNFLQALLAIVLGNLAYFLLAAHFGLPRHRPFQPDAGLLLDFFICLAFYALIRKARK
jgi:hypothetical protein